MAKFLIPFLISVITLLPLSAKASEDLVVGKSFLEDTSNSLSIHDVRNLEFQPYDQKVFVGGYKNSAYWIKLKIKASSEDLVMKIGPSYTDEVQLFDSAERYKKRVTGDTYPWLESDIKTLGLNFKIQASEVDRDIFLRVKSAHSYLFYVDVHDYDTYINADRIEVLLCVGYVILLVVIFIWLGVTWVFNKEKILGLFVIHQLVVLIHSFILLGFARAIFDRYISPESLNNFSYGLIPAYVFWATYCHKSLLKEYQLKKPYVLVLDLILIVLTIAIGLTLFGYAHEALIITAYAILFSGVLISIFSLIGVPKDIQNNSTLPLSIGVIRFYYFGMLLIWVFTQFTMFNIIQMGQFAVFAIYFYGFINGVVLFILLQYRAKMVLKNQINRANQYEAQVAQEKIRRDEQNKLMSMLAHEIKTPLSILKLVVDEKLLGSDLEKPANRAVRNIDNIINKCLTLDRLDAQSVKVNKVSFDLGNLIDDLISDLSLGGVIDKQGNFQLAVTTDRDFLYVVIRNLLENATKYSPLGSRISIASSHDGWGNKLLISNDIGAMGSPEPNGVFEKYYRNIKSSKVSGSGLGLFLVKSLMSLLGGYVEYQSGDKQVHFEIGIPH